MRLIEITSSNQEMSQDAYDVFLNTIGRRYKKYYTNFAVNNQFSYDPSRSFSTYADMIANLKDRVGELIIMVDYSKDTATWEIDTEVSVMAGSVAPSEIDALDLKKAEFQEPREVIKYLDYLMTFCESSLS